MHYTDVEKSLGLSNMEEQEAAPVCIDTVQKEEIVRLLKACGYNKSEVARRLGVNRTTLWRRMGKLGLI